jgi:hypothetical protein
MLLHRAFIIVYFRPGSRAPLRVIAPADTRRLTIRFYGDGLGLLGSSHACPARPTMALYAIRAAARPVLVKSVSRC